MYTNVSLMAFHKNNVQNKKHKPSNNKAFNGTYLKNEKLKSN